jgi:mono/diheme cytochrome c family protein
MRLPFAAALLLSALPAFAQQPLTAPPLPDAPAKAQMGLALTFTGGGKTDTRPARLVALHVPAGQPVSPFVPAGPFTATWEGEIVAALRSSFTFAAEVQGAFKLTINGNVVLEGTGEMTRQSVNKKVQLSKGANKIVAEFASDNRTDATVRLLWWSREFPAEPVPPVAFSHTPSADLRSASRIREGRMLFAQNRCAACHGDSSLPPRGEGMPELAQDAPIFDEMGAKYKEAWLAHWINDPHDIRPRTLMPRVFHGEEGKVDQRAADLAAYFVSLGKPEEDEAAPAADNAPLGGALFANLGCIACHSTPDTKDKDIHGRVPLSHLKAKWQPRALIAYLKQPEKNYAWTRMPNFKLSDEEAERLTAYLLSGEQREFAEPPKGDAARGAQLLVSGHCLNCHAGMPPTTTPTLAVTLQSGWTRGCMAPDNASRGKAPDFHFTPQQREALIAFAAHGFDSLKQDAPPEFAERQIENMSCLACHPRDRDVSRWSKLEDEMNLLHQGAPPVQAEHGEGTPVAGTVVPVFTWFGEKLRPDWMEGFIAGTLDVKPRTWVIARMPGFPAPAKGIAEGLSLEHGFPLVTSPELSADAARLTAGETLLGEHGGFNCTTCHGVGDRPPTAVFEAPGINLGLTPQRLREGYYHRWVMHPLRADPETKMPRFADDDGKTPLTDFYEGDAHEQFEAIWQYLLSVQKK